MVNKYHQILKNKEKVWKEARERYQNVSEEERKESWIYEQLFFSTSEILFLIF